MDNDDDETKQKELVAELVAFSDWHGSRVGYSRVGVWVILDQPFANPYPEHGLAVYPLELWRVFHNWNSP